MERKFVDNTLSVANYQADDKTEAFNMA